MPHSFTNWNLLDQEAEGTDGTQELTIWLPYRIGDVSVGRKRRGARVPCSAQTPPPQNLHCPVTRGGGRG